MSHPPCAPAPPAPCPQTCPQPPPLPPCRPKPIMRGLHMAHVKSVVTQAIVLALTGAVSVYLFIGRPRMAAYKDYYAKAELEDQADEMARKGLFQSVPPESLKDNQHIKKK